MAGACATLSHNFQLLGNHPEVQNQLNTAQATQNLANQMTLRFNEMNERFDELRQMLNASETRRKAM